MIDFDGAERAAREPTFRLKADDTFADMLTDHLYGEHGINMRAGATLRQIEGRHAADHVAEIDEADRPSAWMEHKPNEFYVGRWMQVVPRPTGV